MIEPDYNVYYELYDEVKDIIKSWVSTCTGKREREILESLMRRIERLEKEKFNEYDCRNSKRE